MKTIIVSFGVFIFSLSHASHASWMEFCYASGKIEKIISSSKKELVFDLRVKATETFSPGENLNSYVDCKTYIGIIKRVYYGVQAVKVVGKLTAGMQHCARYEHEDWGDGGIRYWFPGCQNG